MTIIALLSIALTPSLIKYISRKLDDITIYQIYKTLEELYFLLISSPGNKEKIKKSYLNHLELISMFILNGRISNKFSKELFSRYFNIVKDKEFLSIINECQNKKPGTYASLLKLADNWKIQLKIN